jgi:hypothetical protein
MRTQAESFFDYGAAAGEADPERGKRGKLVRLFDYPGFELKGITAQKALKLFFAATSTGGKSADRIRRVMNKSKNPFAQTSTEEESADKYVTALVDPIFVLVQSTVGVSMIVALPMAFDTHEGRGLSFVTEAALSAESTTVHARILNAKLQGSVGDENATIRFQQSSLGQTLKVIGPFVRACTPTVIFESSSVPIWTLPLFSLSMLLELHYLELTSSQMAKAPKAEYLSRWRRDSTLGREWN